MSKILLVDDDQALARFVADALKSEQHVVDVAYEADTARTFLITSNYELVILDWTLPGDVSGISICKEYRAKGGQSPILFLTGRGDIADKEEGFVSGGDDYVTKPFNTRELLARVRALLRRPPTILSSILTIGNVELNSSTYKVLVDGEEVKLFPKEFALLEFFMRHPNHVFNADDVLSFVWSTDSLATIETLRQVMARVRAKLEKSGGEVVIRTIYSVGYVLEKK